MHHALTHQNCAGTCNHLGTPLGWWTCEGRGGACSPKDVALAVRAQTTATVNSICWLVE